MYFYFIYLTTVVTSILQMNVFFSLFFLPFSSFLVRFDLCLSLFSTFLGPSVFTYVSKFFLSFQSVFYFLIFLPSVFNFHSQSI